MSDKKGVLAERPALWLNRVLAAGREVPGGASGGESDGADDLGERPRPRKPLLVEHAATVGEIPQNARVSPEQAESALGRTVAEAIDIDYPDAVDADTREEEEALAGHQVNPSGFDYACIAWQPLAPDSVSAGTVGWEATRPARRLVRSDFTCSKEGVAAKLRGGLAGLASGFRSEMAAAPADFSAVVKELDPTQKVMVEVLVEWADLRMAWRQALPAATGAARLGPPLRLLVLGTAGTGKTHTAKIAINEVRRRFFAQLSPVLASSVLPGLPLIERSGPVARATALAGRQTFDTFEDVIRLRRIHR